MPALRVTQDFAMFNAGRKYHEDSKFRANMARFLRRFPDASKGLIEIDEADPADELGITQNLLKGNRHRQLPALPADLEPMEFGKKGARAWDHLVMGDVELKAKMFRQQFAGLMQATPIITPGTNTTALVGVKVDQTVEGKAHVSPHRVCVQAAYAVPRIDAVFMHLNGHFPYKWPKGWDTCFDSWCDIVRENKKAGFTQFLTLDSNKHGKTPVFHPTQKVFWGDNNIDKGIMIPGDSAVIRARGPIVRVDANIDGHDMWGRRTLILP